MVYFGIWLTRFGALAGLVVVLLCAYAAGTVDFDAHPDAPWKLVVGALIGLAGLVYERLAHKRFLGQLADEPAEAPSV